MKFSEKLNEAENLLRVRRSHQQSVKNIRQFTEDMAQILKALQTIRSLLDCLAVAETLNLFQLSMPNDLVNKMTVALENLQRDITQREDLGRSVSQCERLTVELQNLVNSAWVESVQSKTTAVLATLSTLERFVPKPNDISEITTTLQRSLNSFPTSTVALKKFDVSQKIALKHLESIGEEPEILQFMGKILNHTATMADLTPNITTWFRERKLQDQVMMSFKFVK